MNELSAESELIAKRALSWRSYIFYSSKMKTKSLHDLFYIKGKMEIILEISNELKRITDIK